MWQDLRISVRSLARSRTFTIIACATLALGIGATATTFMLVHAVLIEALPYRDAASIVTLGGRMQRDASVQQFPMSPLDVQSLATDTTAFVDVAAVTNARSFNLLTNGAVEHLDGEMVGPAYFRILGVPLALGRSFTDAENRAPNAARVVVLSHSLWQRRFAGQGSVLGQSVQLNETPYTVIGVAADGFTGLSDNAQLWLPLGTAHNVYGPHYTEMRQFRWLFAIARLRDGVTAEGAQRRVDALSQNLQREFVRENANLSFAVTTLVDAYLGGLRNPLLALFGAGIFVLLIAGTNVASLQLVRSLARRRELAVRSALGASARRLAALAIFESAGLVLVSLVIGLALSAATVRVLRATGSLQLSSYVEPRLHPVVIAVSVGIALICALLGGLIPAVFAARTAPGEGLGEASRGGTSSRTQLRLQRGLVVLEVALALTLLTGAGLMVKGFTRFLSTDLGYRPDNVLSLRIDLTADRFRKNENVWGLIRSLTTGLAAIPGVRGVSAEGPGFPGSGWYQITMLPDGVEAQDGIGARRHHVTPGYFAALGIPLKAGRDLADGDVTGAPTAVVVSERFAEVAWPGKGAIGQRLRVAGNDTLELTVVGVAANVRHGGLQTNDLPQVDVYLSLYQFVPRSPSLVTFFLVSRQSPETLIPVLEPVLRRLDGALAFYDVHTMRQRLRDQTATGRLLVFIMVAFAVIGLVLAALGVYGIIAYTAAQRTREVGIRLALGAGRAKVLRLVIRQAVTPVVAGVLLGAVSVVCFTRFLESLLYGLSPLDPAVLLPTALALLLVAVLASWLPAHRATSVSPVAALRSE